jgi:hypothetical protein
MSTIVNNPALRKAKKDGIKLEKEFVKFCQTIGIGSITYNKWQKSGAEEAGSLDHQDNLLIKNFPYESIYDGSKCKTEFVLILGKRRIRIEFKSQNKKGSKDECLPYIFENAETQFPENELILFRPGKGWREGTKNYITRRIEKVKKVNPNIDIKVFYDYDELKEYTNHVTGNAGFNNKILVQCLGISDARYKSKSNLDEFFA